MNTYELKDPQVGQECVTWWYSAGQMSPLLAAMLIYDKSDPNYKINPARFFDSEKDALADLKRLATGKAKK